MIGAAISVDEGATKDVVPGTIGAKVTGVEDGTT